MPGGIDVSHHVHIPAPDPEVILSFRSAGDSDARVGTENIDSAVHLADGLEEESYLLLVGYVACEKRAAAAFDLLHDVEAVVFIHVGHYDKARAFSSKPQ